MALGLKKISLALFAQYSRYIIQHTNTKDEVPTPTKCLADNIPMSGSARCEEFIAQ